MANKKAVGKRAKTRSKFSRKGSKTTVNKHVIQIPGNSKVQIKTDGSYNKSLPNSRHHGKTGTVLGEKENPTRQGTHYKIIISDRGKSKEVLIHPVHLKVLEQKKVKK